MAFAILQGKIVFVVPGKVHGFCLGRNPLTGVIFEFAAFGIFRHYTLFGTEDQALFEVGAIGAVVAGFGNVFAKQHKQDLLFL